MYKLPPRVTCPEDGLYCVNPKCAAAPGGCIDRHARHALEADQGYPETRRVLHTDLPRDQAEAKVDESRVPPNRNEALRQRVDSGEFDAHDAGGCAPPVFARSIPRYPDEERAHPVKPEEYLPIIDVSQSWAEDRVKDSNPKDAIGVLKIALTYVSLPVLLEVALGMMEGGFKYGRHNYREAGVRASVYVDATFRHLAAFWEGEDFDPDIQAKCGIDVSHITKAIASLTVLRDSMIRGNWVDDRPPAVAPGWIAKLSEDVKKLAAAYSNPVPPVTEIGLKKRHQFDSHSPKDFQ